MAEPNNTLSIRVGFISFLFLMTALILVVRLIQVQIIEHHENVEELEDKLTRVRYFMSGRGKILSREGHILAEDAPSYQLQCQLSEIPFGKDFGVIEEINFFLFSGYKRYKELKKNGLETPSGDELLEKIDRIEPRLKREMVVLDLSHHLDIELNDLSRALKEAMENCVKRWSYPQRQQILDIHLSLKAAQTILNNPDRYQGFSCIESSTRHYPQGELASHLVGYMGRLNEKNYHVLRAKGYYPPDPDVLHPITLSDLEKKRLSWVRNFQVGVSGVEWIHNNRLRGKLHQFTYRRDLSHLPLDEPEIKEGEDVRLTIQLELQKLGTDLMKGRQGSIILYDINNGDVLCAVSLPSYDPNLLTPPNQVPFNAYIESRPGMLMNRCFSNHYPFGSVYKIITSIAALEEGLVTADSTYFCATTHGKTKLKCLGYHADINVGKALERSCNIYYYEAALALGPYKLYQWARRFHLGQTLDIGFPYERSGVNPNPAYKLDTVGEMWYPGDTCHMAIGQGFQLGTPLQAAVIAGMVSRPEGTAKPRFWNRLPIEHFKLPIHQETLDIVRKGLWRVVQAPHGTAHLAKSEHLEFAGKTGTADVYGKDPHAWFAGFAPYEDPKVAFSVIIEHGGHGGDEAAPIAKAILEAWLKLQHEG